MNKKLFFIIAGIIIIILVIIVFLSSSNTNKQPTQTTVVKAINNPDITKLFETEVQAPVLNSNKENIFYFDASGKGDLAFHAFNLLNHKISPLSPTMQPMEDIIWAPSRDKAILKIIYQQYAFQAIKTIFGDPKLEENTQYTWLYDFRTKKLTLIGPNIQALAWSQDSQKIIYQRYDSDNNVNEFAIANPDGSSEEKIIDVPDSIIDLNLGTLVNNKFYYYPTVSEAGRGSYLFLMDIQTKQISKLTNNPSTVEAMTSPDHKTILLNYYNAQDKRYGLGAIWPEENKNIDYKIDISLDKIAFSENNDFLVGAVSKGKGEKLIKIDLATGKTTDLYNNLPEDFVIYNLMLGKDDKTLYFTNKNTFYQLKLE